MPNPSDGDHGARPHAEVVPRVELELPLRAASPFDLAAAVCSHGLFMMAPNRWDPAARTLVRPLRLASDRSISLLVRVSAHPVRPDSALLVSVQCTGALAPIDQDAILEQVRRMLRLSEEDERAVEEFQAMHAVAREVGFGRIFRSPTLFEDMVKCILLCNCQWSRSLSMATALCKLQLELKLSSNIETLQSRTPPIRERKRKHSKKDSVRVRLETRFVDDKLEDPILAMDTSNDITFKDVFSFPSIASETCSTYGSFDSSEFSSSNAQLLEDCTGDFPTPEELANLNDRFLAKHCNVGYRATRIIMLARSIVEGSLCLENLEKIRKMSIPPAEEASIIQCSYERLNKELSTISGFGPFTRANVLMCMGYFHIIPADTETIRHLKQIHRRESNINTVHEELDELYGQYAPFQFLAYWFELWGFYDKQFGKISDMDPSKYRLFSASHLKKAILDS